MTRHTYETLDPPELPGHQDLDKTPGISSADESDETLDIPVKESVNGDMEQLTVQSGTMGLLAREFVPKRAVSYLRVSTREQAQRGGREEGFRWLDRKSVV